MFAVLKADDAGSTICAQVPEFCLHAAQESSEEARSWQIGWGKEGGEFTSSWACPMWEYGSRILGSTADSAKKVAANALMFTDIPAQCHCK